MPPQQKKRYVVLDALRGFAILGIILANFPEFSLWTFSDPSTWTRTDTVTRAVQTFFVDGKFYTLFSLLFGVGFSIQIANAGGKLRTFYRRMAVLLCIGLIHLFFLWSGDILALFSGRASRTRWSRNNGASAVCTALRKPISGPGSPMPIATVKSCSSCTKAPWNGCGNSCRDTVSSRFWPSS